MSQSILIVWKSRFFYTLPDRIQPLLWNFRKSNIGAVQVINAVLCFLAGRDFPYFGISRTIYIAPAGLSVRRTAFDISTLPPSIASLSDVFTSSCNIKPPADTLLTTNDLKIEVVADYLNKLDNKSQKDWLYRRKFSGGGYKMMPNPLYSMVIQW